MSGSDGENLDLFGLVGYQLDEKYAIDAAVARGGFGVVYRARHVVLQTLHAVKVLNVPPELSATVRERFLEQFVEEARIIAQFQHPAIVRVSDFGVSILHSGDHAPWMVLEWIEGQTLAAYLAARRGRGGHAPQECLDLLHPVIDALAEAHERGIAHRDIKPGNVMIVAEQAPATTVMRAPTRRGASARPQVRVLDFGIAKIMTDADEGPVSGNTRTQSLAPAFSPRYASPEQVSGTRTGPWTDVHALGLILTEMLVDQAPYTSADKIELQMQIVSPIRPTPARFGVDVGAWEAVLAKALSVHPKDRYPDAGALFTALESEVPAEVRRLDFPGATPTPATFFQTAPAPVGEGGSPDVFAPMDTIPTLTPAEKSSTRAGTRARAAWLLAASFVVVCVVAGVTLARLRVTTRPTAQHTAHTPNAEPPAPPREDAGAALPPVAQALVVAPLPVDPPSVPVADVDARPPGARRGHGHRVRTARPAASTRAPRSGRMMPR